MSRTSQRSRERGQMLVLMAGGLIAFLVMTALIVDGGNAWAQQRQTQNGTDAAAQAGATVLAQKLGNDPTTQGAAAAAWDAATLAAVNNIASANKNDPPVAYYTDICGVLLKRDGSKATAVGDAATVGDGFPTSVAMTPDCPNGIVGPVAGVEVHDSKVFRTWFAGAVGIENLTAGALATAVTGFVQSCQSSDEGCAVLPVNIPVWFSVCNGHDLAQNTVGIEWPMNETVVLPLCFNSPGNIGWIDFTPPAGGADEVKDCILTPCNPAIPLPSWQYITQTGTDHSSPVETALNSWAGQVVLFPMFDHTCGDDQPDQSLADDVDQSFGCAALDDAHGQNLWYRIPRFAAFKLQAAYTNGNNLSSCQNQSKQCLVGQFVHFIVSGTVGPGSGGGTTDTSTIGVQLIK